MEVSPESLQDVTCELFHGAAGQLSAYSTSTLYKISKVSYITRQASLRSVTAAPLYATAAYETLGKVEHGCRTSLY